MGKTEFYPIGRNSYPLVLGNSAIIPLSIIAPSLGGEKPTVPRKTQQRPPSMQSVSSDARYPFRTLLRLLNACCELQATRSMR